MSILPSPCIKLSDIFSILAKKPHLPNQDSNIVFTVDGRTALYNAVCALSKKQSSRKWLIPAYFCPSVHHVFKDSGVPFEFYPIGEDMQPVAEFLIDKLSTDKEISGILFIDYFGFRTNVEPFDSIINKNNISVIFDCAHVLMSDNHDFNCKENEAYIYSLRKWFPIPHGGALVTNNVNFEKDSFFKVSNFKLYKQLIKYFAYYMEDRMRLGLRKNLLSFKPISKFLEKKDVADRYDFLMHDKVVSFLNEKILSRDSIKTKQRENYLLYADLFSSNEKYRSLQPQLKNDECPFVFPIIVRHRNRDEILKKCLREGLPLRVFWRFLSDCVPKEDVFKTSHKLSESLLCLPVHYEITNQDIEMICKKLFNM